MVGEGSLAGSGRWLRRVRGWHVAASIAVISALTIALALDDWGLALAFLAGATVGVAPVLIAGRGRRRASSRRDPGNRQAYRIAALVMGIWVVCAGFLVLAVLAFIALGSLGGGGGAPPPLRPVFKTYTVLVRRDASTPDAFALDISVSTVDGGVVPLGTRHVGSASATGFLARQVVMPGPGRYSAPVSASAGTGPTTENLCQLICPDVNVRFEDFPVDSIWEVQRGTIDDHRVSGDTEVVTASIAGIDIGTDDIRFTYFPAPYSTWRPYLGPIPGASSLPVLLVALVGTVLSGTWLLALAGVQEAILRLALGWRHRKAVAEPAPRADEPESGAEPAHPPRTSSLRRGRPHH